MIKSMSTSADLPATQKPFQESSTHAQDLSRNWWGLKKKKMGSLGKFVVMVLSIADVCGAIKGQHSAQLWQVAKHFQ